MKKVIIDEEKIITLSDVMEAEPIFATCNKRLCGMVVYSEKWEWHIATGGSYTAVKCFETLRGCLVEAQRLGYEFFVED